VQALDPAAEYCPERQLKQLEPPVTDKKVPAAQLTQALAPMPEYDPSEQLVQLAATVKEKVPNAQLAHEFELDPE